MGFGIPPSDEWTALGWAIFAAFMAACVVGCAIAFRIDERHQARMSPAEREDYDINRQW